MTDKSTSVSTASTEVQSQPAKGADHIRRHMLKAGTLAGGALLLSAPYIRKAEAAKTTIWKVQSSWDA
ncbi:MAG: hypothetical protein GTO41_29400, partial [Burkholderiales bacterium]|nr:hypothetical protein [Burkholderiales bacterium]